MRTRTTGDAHLLMHALLEADPLRFADDPETELNRLTTYTCPECKSANTSQPNNRGLVDCLDCGSWFEPYRLQQEDINPDPETPEEIEAYAMEHGAPHKRKSITNIYTESDYKEYQLRVEDFFKSEGITNLSSVANEDGNNEPYFSWRTCNCCRRGLGGDREKASGYNPTTQQIQEYEVCTDCLYYAEYGQLDDMTMMNLKPDKETED